MPRAAPRARAGPAMAVTLLLVLVASSGGTAAAPSEPTASTHTYLLSADSGAPRPGHAPVPLMRAEPASGASDHLVVPLAGQLASLAGLPPTHHGTANRTWYADAPVHADATIEGATRTRLYLGPEVHPDAWLVVTLGAENLDSEHRSLAQAYERLELVTNGRLAVAMLDTDGVRVFAGDILTLRITVHGTSALHWLHYGTPNTPSGIPTLRLKALDTDADGWPDSEERRRGTNPFVAAPTPHEARSPPGHDVDRDRDRDRDRDGLGNDHERHHGTDPTRPDSDGDGVLDGIEHRHGGDPLDPTATPADTDHDGLPDTFEVAHRLDPTSADSDRDGTDDGAEDPDQDGLDNRAEAAYGTNPHHPDTDGDGRSDGLEVARGTDPLVPQAAAATVHGRTVGAALTLMAGSVAVGATGAASGVRCRAPARGTSVALLVGQSLAFVLFWSLTWTNRNDWLGTVLALQATILLAQVGLLGLRLRRPRPMPGQQAPSVAR